MAALEISMIAYSVGIYGEGLKIPISIGKMFPPQKRETFSLFMMADNCTGLTLRGLESSMGVPKLSLYLSIVPCMSGPETIF
jgi:hypothetical protein